MLEQLKNNQQKNQFQYPEKSFHQFSCKCEMCTQYEHKKAMDIISIRTKITMDKLQQRSKGLNPTNNTNNDYLWIIKKLQLPKNKIVTRGIQVFIPQICFYKDGQPTSLFMTKQIMDYTLKEVCKDRLGNTFLQKTFNERRRKYREKILSINKLTAIQKRKKSFFLNKDETKIDMKDAVVVKKIDGQQLITQNQFIFLMARRRQDPFWNKIIYIKNFIPIKDEIHYNMVIKYEHGIKINEALFQRAHTLTRIYGKNIRQDQKNYISQDDQNKFIKDLCQKDIKQLFQYIVYKIVNFVLYFHDTKIKKGYFQFALDQLKHPILINFFKLQQQQLVKYDWNNQVYQKRVQQNQQKIFYSKQLPLLSQGSLMISQRIQDIMDQQYENMKTHYGLSLKIVQNSQDAQNNAFFKKIHPQCKVDISHILTKDLGIDEFKKKYLGWKRQKKPLVTAFKSGMLRILHNMTPVSKRKLHSSDRTQTLREIPGTSQQKKRSTRQSSTRGSFNKTTMAKLQEINKSLNFYDF